ncbi:MAG: family 20 glycosylhydrolase, partial [Bryobacterales bacterium]|nr:family 20 glycosylhydrolase [Bryobacterales bacterium]
VQGLGHVSFILKWPQFARLREIADSNWEFCPRMEGTYKLLFDLWEEAMEATPGSEYIHIGTDETYELGLGTACGCKQRAEEVGKYGLLQDFVSRSASHLMAKGRKVISWGGEYRPDEKILPVKNLITAEFGTDLAAARASKDAGYPAWIYDPNPGIEHLFLPYDYRLTGKNEEKTTGALAESHDTLAPGARSGIFDGMVSTSWDDSGLHNQVWMMRFVHAAEDSWSGGIPGLQEFQDKYFANYYGPEARDLKELWLLMTGGAYYYMDTFERKVWHWGDIGKTHTPDLPRGDAIEYSPYWNTQYKTMVERSRAQLTAMARAMEICQANQKPGIRHGYDFEMFESMAKLIAHTARTYVALSEVERHIGRANRLHFISHAGSLAALNKAAETVEGNLRERDEAFNQLVATWEKTRLPKGLSTPEKKYFYQQDRARHFANRQPDMTYLIYDEDKLGLADYLTGLQGYIKWYENTYLAKQ